MNVEIRLMEPKEIAECESILRSLPDWFGIEESIVEYVKDISRMETVVAATGNGIAGFLTLKRHNRYSWELHVMGVRQEFHRGGIGRALVERAEELIRSRKCEYFQVKTLGPSRPNESYEMTRRFYESVGFRPLEEHDLWGEVNPCLVMVKKI